MDSEKWLAPLDNYQPNPQIIKSLERVLCLQKRKRQLLFFPKRTMPTFKITEVSNLQSRQERPFDIEKTALDITGKKICIPSSLHYFKLMVGDF